MNLKNICSEPVDCLIHTKEDSFGSLDLDYFFFLFQHCLNPVDHRCNSTLNNTDKDLSSLLLVN